MDEEWLQNQTNGIEPSRKEKYLLNGVRAWVNKKVKKRNEVIMQWHNGAWVRSITGPVFPSNKIFAVFSRFCRNLLEVQQKQEQSKNFFGILSKRQKRIFWPFLLVFPSKNFLPFLPVPSKIFCLLRVKFNYK